MAGSALGDNDVVSKWVVKERLDGVELKGAGLSTLTGGGSNQLLRELLSWPESRRRVKNLVRLGVVASERQQLWSTTSGGLQFSQSSGDLYTETLQDLFGSGVRENLPCPRPYVPPSGCQWWHLSEAGQSAGCRVLVAIERTHPDIPYCPDLQPLVAILLHVIDDEAVCFNILSGLINSGNRDPVYLVQSQSAATSSQHSFGEVARRKAKTSYRWLRTGMSEGGSALTAEDMNRNLADWMTWIFQWLPVVTVIRIVDCFLVEGRKVFYRVALALMKLTYRTIDAQGRRSSTRPNIEAVKAYSNTAPTTVLLQAAFKVRNLSWSLIEQCQRQTRASLASPVPSERLSMVNIESRPNAAVVSGGETQSEIVSDKTKWSTIFSWLPARYQISKPRRVFCTDNDGYSLSTLYKRCGVHEPLLMFIKTTNQEVFGAFLSASLDKRHGSKAFTYFGSGETFLFSVSPAMDCYRWSGIGKADDAPSVDYFTAGDTKCMAVGGGEGYGIWLDASLDNGTSTKCTTFNNPSLVSSQEGDFRVASLEIHTLDDE